MKAVDKGDSSKDEQGTKKEGSDDAPKKGWELGFFRNSEVAEKNGKYENIVDAEGEFNDIAGKKLHRGGKAEGESDQTTECKSQGNPAGGGLEGAAKIHGPGITME